MNASSESQESSFSQEELRFLKTNYNKAKDLLEKVVGLSSRYEATALILKNHEEEIGKLSNEAKEKLNSIENSKSESSSSVLEIKSNLEKVLADIARLDEGLQRFENIKGKIEARDGEIDVLVSTANGLKEDIEGAKAVAQQRLQEIDSIFAKIQEDILKINEAYNSFLALNEKFSDENTGLQAVLNQATDIQKKAKEVFQEISSFRDESKEQLNLIQANKEATDLLREQIAENLAKTEADRDQVASITALITDTGFANEFQRRERNLFWGSVIWLVILLASIGALGYMLDHLFGEILDTVPRIEVIAYRLSLTSPLLILIGFAIAQYRHDRSLTERYAFKAVIAAVVRNHTKFLTELTTDSNPETISFAKETIQNVYKEPYLKENKTSDSSNKKQKKLNLKEMVESTKELQELVPDASSLEKVVSLLANLSRFR